MTAQAAGFDLPAAVQKSMTLKPGDIVLVPNPSYPIHIYGPVIAGADIHHVPMHGGVDFFESLETRKLLSAAIDDNGTLVLTGTLHSDKITVSLKEGDSSKLLVADNGEGGLDRRHTDVVPNHYQHNPRRDRRGSERYSGPKFNHQQLPSAAEGNRPTPR